MLTGGPKMAQCRAPNQEIFQTSEGQFLNTDRTQIIILLVREGTKEWFPYPAESRY